MTNEQFELFLDKKRIESGTLAAIDWSARRDEWLR